VSKHVIRLRGCDDTTDIEIDLTPTEMRVIERLVAKTDVIGGGCKPTIIIDPEPLR
jgi:hypothetical protein